jgi:hypothetical protein
MAIMRVSLVELLCRVALGWIPTLKYLLSGTHGAYGHVLSYQAITPPLPETPTHDKNLCVTGSSWVERLDARARPE